MTMNSDKATVSRFSQNCDIITPQQTEREDAAHHHNISRRGFVTRTAAAVGLAGLLETGRQVEAGQRRRATISPRESIKITKLETFVL
ncbi:MAG TPA: twin-arginine translocation signal domain-containing protein, partial [Phycisphaerales bacterium]|nr:twin-arginine translocation signal domain-containing protein [Phycisphaerales bacterium]